MTHSENNMEETADTAPAQGTGQSTENLPEAQAMGKYIKLYLLSYYIIAVGVGIVVYLLNLGDTPGISIIPIIGASTMCTRKFIQVSGRGFLLEERRAIAWWANLVILSVIAGIILLLWALVVLTGLWADLRDEIPIPSFGEGVILILIGSFLQYWIIRLFLKISNRWALKSYQAKQAAQEG